MPSSIPVRALLVPLVLAASACQIAGGRPGRSDSPSLQASVSSLGSMHNVAAVDGVWIGSVPTAADLDLARRRGIATVIDLTLPEEAPAYDVESTCSGHKMTYLHPRVKPRGLPDETIDQVLAELRKPDRAPLLLFCSDGTRAAMMLAIWRGLDGGIGVERAIVEARRSGMKPGVPESFVRLQIARRTAHSELDAAGRA